VGAGVEAASARAGGGVDLSSGLRWMAAYHVVLRRLRDLFGGRLRLVVCGGAPVQPDAAALLRAAGLPVLEAYGLTEVSGVCHLPRPGRERPGTVGPPLDGVESRISPDGEILVRGDVVMRGYHGRPDETAAAMVAGGWLRTGDLGSVADDGHLTVLDRSKEMITLCGGRRVSPEVVERRLNGVPPIDHIVVFGEGRPSLTALVFLDQEALLSFARERGIKFESYEDLTQHPEVYRAVEAVVADANRKGAAQEAVTKFAVADQELSVEDGDLTPTGRVRRRQVGRRYRSIIESFYKDGY
jgi:long-chain acyl-CoA synthetase